MRMKLIPFTIVTLLITSCNSQMNLEQFKFDDKIPIQIAKLIEDQSVFVPLQNLYKVKDLDEFKYSGIELKNESIEFKDELYVRENTLKLIVNSYKTNDYLGFELYIINKKMSEVFLDLFNKNHGVPLKKHEHVKKEYEDKRYLWVDNDKIIYYNKHNEPDHKNYKTGEKQTLSETRIIILKQGLTAYIDYSNERNTPEKIKNILDDNPNAFDLLEIFKSHFPN